VSNTNDWWAWWPRRIIPALPEAELKASLLYKVKLCLKKKKKKKANDCIFLSGNPCLKLKAFVSRAFVMVIFVFLGVYNLANEQKG
jgi:hypothetical protein